MAISVHRFSNGLRHVHYRVPHAKVAHIGVIVKAGTRNELNQGAGTAHALEHMLFKGTEKRKAFHVLNRIDSIGGELNAYTNKEDICLYASVPHLEVPRTMDLLADMFYNSVLPEKEWKKEKAVILDELFAYEDDIQENMTELFEEILYENHPLSNRIVGYEDQLRNLSVEDLRKFYRSYFTNDNAVVFSTGPQEAKKYKSWVAKFFSRETPKAELSEIVDPLVHIKEERRKTGIVQSHTTLGGQAPGNNSPEKDAMGLLINVLGGPNLNNKLSLNIREKYGYAYFLEANYITYSDSGFFEVYFNTEPRQQEKCEALVRKELDKFCRKPMTDTALKSAVKQLKGQVVLGYDNTAAVGQYVGRQLLNYDTVETFEEHLSRYDAITSAQVYELANRYFRSSRLSRLIFEPK